MSYGEECWTLGDLLVQGADETPAGHSLIEGGILCCQLDAGLKDV